MFGKALFAVSMKLYIWHGAGANSPEIYGSRHVFVELLEFWLKKLSIQGGLRWLGYLHISDSKGFKNTALEIFSNIIH